MGFSAVGEPSRLARGARITAEIWKMDLKGSVAWVLLRGGEPSRVARGARITGEIWKMNIKGSVVWGILRKGSLPDWCMEPCSSLR
jgi:hypothetical protein